MGYVTKTVTEVVGDVAKTTSHMFEKSEDFLRWEKGQVSNQGGKVDGKVGRRCRVIGNELSHGFEIGETVVVTSIDEGGCIRASNGVEWWWMTEEELEEV